MANKKTFFGSMSTKHVGGRFEKVMAIVSGAKSEYGATMLHNAAAREVTLVPRVSTGLYKLDIALGGGFPLGRITLVYGEKSGGKTTLYLMGLANAQRLCANCLQPGTFEVGDMEIPNFKTGKLETITTHVITSCPCGNPRDFIALWCDSENSWYGPWLKQRGVWAEKVILLKPEYGEAAYDIIRGMMQTGAIDLTVIDSLAQLAPETERETSMRDAHQGVSARMNNRYLRELPNIMMANLNSGRTTTTWLVNQIRHKIGVMFGNPEVLTGGKGQGFVASAEIDIRPSTISKSKAGVPLFRDHKWTVKKSKISPPGMSGGFQMSLANVDHFRVGQIMEHESAIEDAVEFGIIEKPSERIYVWDGERYKKGELVQFFAANPSDFAELRSLIVRNSIVEDDEDAE